MNPKIAIILILTLATACSDTTYLAPDVEPPRDALSPDGATGEDAPGSDLALADLAEADGADLALPDGAADGPATDSLPADLPPLDAPSLGDLTEADGPIDDDGAADGPPIINDIPLTLDQGLGDLTPTPPPVRSCLTPVSYFAGPGAGQVAMAGEFNGWSTSAHPLTDNDGDGEYTADLDLSPGDYGYKIVLNGTDWRLDPMNPYLKVVGTEFNSRLFVQNCSLPLLTLVSLQASPDGSATAILNVEDGSQLMGLDPSGLTALLDGKPAQAFLNQADWTITLTAQGLSVPSKHAFTVSMADKSGNHSDELYLPFWVEEHPFSWDDGVIYFAFTDRFANGDPSNDHQEPGVDSRANYNGGDFAGVIDKIQEGYFDDLGVNVLWLSPVYDNPSGGWMGSDGRLYAGYHGYWPSSIENVDEHFGTMAELQELVDEAHSHGIRILLDFVANHVHESCSMFLGHPSWFHGEEMCGGDNWGTTCWFADYLPDIDYRETEALDGIVDNATYWVEALNADGFRVDAVKHLDQDYMHNFTKTFVARMAERYEITGHRFYTVGETFVGDWRSSSEPALIKEYIGPDQLDGQFDFPLYWEIIKTFARHEQTFSDLDWMLQQSLGYYGPGSLMSNFLGNHDIPRFASHANGDIGDIWGNGSKEQGWNNPPGAVGPEAIARAKMGFTFLMSLPGLPLIYYGDEVALPGAGDPDNRRPMTFDVTADQRALMDHVGRVSHLRHDHPALRGEDWMTLQVEGDIYVVGRKAPGDVAVVAFNRSGEPRNVTVSLAGLGLSDGTTLEDGASARGGSASVSSGQLSFDLQARESRIFVQP